LLEEDGWIGWRIQKECLTQFYDDAIEPKQSHEWISKEEREKEKKREREKNGEKEREKETERDRKRQFLGRAYLEWLWYKVTENWLTENKQSTFAKNDLFVYFYSICFKCIIYT